MKMESRKPMATKVRRVGTTPAQGHTEVRPGWHIFRHKDLMFFGYSRQEVFSMAYNYQGASPC